MNNLSKRISKECTVCKKSTTIPNNYNDIKDNTFVCKKCKRSKKNRGKIITSLLIVTSFIGAISWLYISNNSKDRKAIGFKEVTFIQDSIKVRVKDTDKVAFDVSSITVSSTPVVTQAPVNNLEDFNRIMAENIEEVRKRGSNTLYIPTSTILFQFNSSKLSENSSAMIFEIVNLFNRTNKKSNIIVEGFTCDIGNERINYNVSQQRANVVSSALISQGVDPNKIKVQWYGKSKNKEFKMPNQSDYRRVLISFQ